MALSDDDLACGMLALAETFRSSSPPRFKMAIKCVRGALKLPNVSPAIFANIQLQLGKLLVFYTENYDLARDTLEETYAKMLEWGEYLVPYRLEALQLLCVVYTHGIISPANSNHLMSMIKTEFRYYEGDVALKSKLLMYYIEAAANAGLATQAVMGCDWAISNFIGNTEMELYFRITKALMYMKLHETYLTEQEHQKINQLLAALDPKSPYSANINLYFDSVQVVMLLYEGKTRSVRTQLRNIQMGAGKYTDTNCIQTGLRWMCPTSLTAFACLMTLANAGYQNHIERITRYFTLIVRHVNDYLTKVAKQACDYGIMRTVQRIRLVANEFAAQAHIIAGKPSDALNNMKDIFFFAATHGPFVHMEEEFLPIIQNLLGVYCVYLRDFELAEKHFNSALMIRPNLNKNIVITVNTNLCLLYLVQCKHAEYYSIAENLVPNRVDACTFAVRANVKFVLSLHLLLINKVHEFRRLSEEALNYAKSEDLFRLHNLLIMVCSLALPVGVDALHTCINWGTKGMDYMLLHWAYVNLSRVMGPSEDATACDEKAEFARIKICRETLLALHNENVQPTFIDWLDGDPKELGYLGPQIL